MCFGRRQIEDGTGLLEVREYVNTSESDYQHEQRQKRREGVYVRVVGAPKAFKDKRSVQVTLASCRHFYFCFSVF